ncbi:uncharacterized protein VTP21DRAFT_5387 [Calcarisporiella thermophila]|uniref:uncharacterized protein n=1 Tax=Calcarisporiella thermophila TaxID=911321 RepID=UPI003742F699
MNKIRPRRSDKDLRRAIKDKISGPIGPPTRNDPTLTPSTKVIKAIQDYRATRPGELSFRQGDFFLVVNKQFGDWIEACNPVTKARGLVPLACFQMLESTAPQVESLPTRKQGDDLAEKKAAKKIQSLYGVVMYDFRAEREDELEARRGESLVLIAHSSLEWFVAKPIGRLGGPGLIPCAFVEVRDPASGRPVPNVEALLQKDYIPKVEEWKKMARGYEATSIPLGRFDYGQKMAARENRIAEEELDETDESEDEVFERYQGPPPKHHPHPLQQQGLPLQTRAPQPQYQAPWPQQHLHNVKKMPSLEHMQQRNLPPQLRKMPSMDHQQLRQPRAESPALPPKTTHPSEWQLQHQQHQQHQHQHQHQQQRTPTPLQPIMERNGPSPVPHNVNRHPLKRSGTMDSDTLGDFGDRLHLNKPRENEDTVVSAGVDSFYYDEGEYWFICHAETRSGERRKLYRTYGHFYGFQVALLDRFPREAGRAGDERILPYMPGPTSAVDDAITAQRRVDLDVYVKELCQLPERIRGASLFDQLFGLQGRDHRDDTPDFAVQKQGLDSSSSLHPPPTPGTNGGGGYTSHPNSPMSSAPPSPIPDQPKTAVQAMIDSLPTPPIGAGDQTTSHPSYPQQPSLRTRTEQHLIKVKIFHHQDEIIVIRVPFDITADELRMRVDERITLPPTVAQWEMVYKDPTTGERFPVQKDEDLDRALAKDANKILVHIEY